MVLIGKSETAFCKETGNRDQFGVGYKAKSGALDPLFTQPVRCKNLFNFVFFSQAFHSSGIAVVLISTWLAPSRLCMFLYGWKKSNTAEVYRPARWERFK
jgi:hypothetical protein